MYEGRLMAVPDAAIATTAHIGLLMTGSHAPSPTSP